MGLYLGTIKIAEVYKNNNSFLSIYKNGQRIVSLNKELYVWLLEDVIKHRIYIWKDTSIWDDNLMWNDSSDIVTYSAFNPPTTDMFANIDQPVIMSDYKLINTDTLKK